MSDNYLQLIPVDPGYVPSPAAQATARDLLAAFVPEADAVNAKVTPRVEFITPAANLERVLCPVCRAELAHDWWVAAMDAAGTTGYNDLRVTVPCCGATQSLNDLGYDCPAGFARFVLRVLNPHIFDLDARTIHSFEQLLGCPLRTIWTCV